MSARVETRRVTPDDAPLLATLEGQCPPAMRFGEGGLRERLELLETNGNSLSWLAELKGACVGFLLAWTDLSLIDVPRPPKIILIDNLVVRPEHPTQLYVLLKLLAEDIAAQNLGNLTIEGVCRRRAYKVFQEHETAINRLGYEPAGTYEYWEDTLGEEVCWMRFVPLTWAEGGAASAEGGDAWIPADDVTEEPWVPLEETPLEETPAAEKAPEPDEMWQPASRKQMLKIRRPDER